MQRLRLIAILAAVFVASPAAAQKADATVAFQRGQQLKRDGKLAEACAAFELSMKLDAQFGTQYNLALCYVDLGRTASAWAELDELSSKDPNQARRADAARRARELRPRLTSVAIKLIRPVPRLTVTRDGIDISILVGTPLPVDPGKHRFAARAPGRREWSTEVALAGEGKTIVVTVPALEPDAAALPVPAAPPVPEPVPGVASPAVTSPAALGAPESTAEDPPGHTRRIAGIAAFSVGAASLVIGSVYGVRALSRGSDARRECGGEVAQCTGDAVAAQHLIDDGRGFARISNVALVAGGVLTAAGVVLYVTAPRGVVAAPLVAPGAIGFALSGPL